MHDCLILHSDLGELDIHVIVLYCRYFMIVRNALEYV